MEPISEKLKLIYILVIRQIRKIFFVVPIKKNRVMFESFSGDSYGCNPKYISIMLKEKYGEKVEVIWGIKDKSNLPKNVISCKYRSFKHFFYRITSKVYVCNFLQAVDIPKRKSQIEIQTWHGGGCYKKIGNEEKARGIAYIIRRNMHIAETDYFIASSKYFEKKVIYAQLGYRGKILKIGMPRNDCLMEIKDINKIHRIRKKAGIDKDAFVVLYAPTWRENFDEYESIDYKTLKKATENRFKKKTQIIFRAHLYGKEKTEDKDILDLSNYPDMQELLYACDMLITDFSSSIWDFSLTEKPCFLYVPDLKHYIDKRGFDRDIYMWGFPVCQSNKQLCHSIEQFDANKFKKAMQKHQTDLNTYETGKATERVVNLIADICGLKG